MTILQKESELEEIVKLVGIDALSGTDRLTMEAAQMIREDFLQQNAMSDTDSYCSLDKQYALLGLIMEYYREAGKAIAAGADMNKVFAIESRHRIGRGKDVPQSEYKKQFADISASMKTELERLSKEEASL